MLEKKQISSSIKSEREKLKVLKMQELEESQNNHIYGGRYEDKRLPAPWDDAAWKTWKAEKPLTPWGTIPVLDYQGLVIGQSTAASRLTRAETVELQESRQRV